MRQRRACRCVTPADSLLAVDPHSDVWAGLTRPKSGPASVTRMANLDWVSNGFWLFCCSGASWHSMCKWRVVCAQVSLWGGRNTLTDRLRCVAAHDACRTRARESNLACCCWHGLQCMSTGPVLGAVAAGQGQILRRLWCVCVSGPFSPTVIMPVPPLPCQCLVWAREG